MSCNGCTKGFGWFSKEYGCGRCKHSFCSNCLKYTIKTAEKKKLNVCLRCFEFNKNILPAPVSNITEPERNIINVANPLMMDTPEIPDANILPPLTADEILKKRLETLKGEDEVKKIPTDVEIEMRLAKLRDIEYKQYKNKAKFLPDNRTDVQKTDDLIKQVLEEAELSKNLPNPDEEIERRLKALKADREDAHTSNLPNPIAATKSDTEREQDIVSNSTADSQSEDDEERDSISDIDSEDEDEKEDKTDSDNSEYDEAEVDKIVKKYQDVRNHSPDPNNHDYSCAGDEPPPLTDDELVEKLPICSVCKVDYALIKCIECSERLFCKPCFDKSHEHKKHRTLPYMYKTTLQS